MFFGKGFNQNTHVLKSDVQISEDVKIGTIIGEYSFNHKVRERSRPTGTLHYKASKLLWLESQACFNFLFDPKTTQTY